MGVLSGATGHQPPHMLTRAVFHRRLSSRDSVGKRSGVDLAIEVGADKHTGDDDLGTRPDRFRADDDVRRGRAPRVLLASRRGVRLRRRRARSQVLRRGAQPVVRVLMTAPSAGRPSSRVVGSLVHENANLVSTGLDVHRYEVPLYSDSVIAGNALDIGPYDFLHGLFRNKAELANENLLGQRPAWATVPRYEAPDRKASLPTR
jgi:hypothetical protein